MFFGGIRSERHLIATTSFNLAHRWYLGYALDEDLPDHSILTRIRQRLAIAIFQRFFEQIVDLCQEAGLVWGKEIHFDATEVEAATDVDCLVRRFYHEARTPPHQARGFVASARCFGAGLGREAAGPPRRSTRDGPRPPLPLPEPSPRRCAEWQVAGSDRSVPLTECSGRRQCLAREAMSGRPGGRGPASLTPPPRGQWPACRPGPGTRRGRPSRPPRPPPGSRRGGS